MTDICSRVKTHPTAEVSQTLFTFEHDAPTLAYIFADLFG